MIDIESQIKPRLAAIGGSIALLAFLAGCSKTVLSESTNGTASLSREVALRVNAALKELEAFVASVAPIKPDLRDARAVSLWLEDFRTKRSKAVTPGATPDAWDLLKDLAVSDPDVVCAARGLDRTELIAQLTAAREKLHTLTESLAASNVDRARLHRSL